MPGPCAAGSELPHGETAVCDLDVGHHGTHVDLFEGWEWVD